MPGLDYGSLRFGYHLAVSALVFAWAWRQHGKNHASDTLENPAMWQIDEECRRYWEPTDPNDIAFLQMANESRFQNTTLPSGYKTPDRPCISRNGRLYDGRDLDLSLS